jgi:hypothetical protein
MVEEAAAVEAAVEQRRGLSLSRRNHQSRHRHLARFRG